MLGIKQKKKGKEKPWKYWLFTNVGDVENKFLSTAREMEPIILRERRTGATSKNVVHRWTDFEQCKECQRFFFLHFIEAPVHQMMQECKREKVHAKFCRRAKCRRRRGHCTTERNEEQYRVWSVVNKSESHKWEMETLFVMWSCDSLIASCLCVVPTTSSLHLWNIAVCLNVWLMPWLINTYDWEIFQGILLFLFLCFMRFVLFLWQQNTCVRVCSLFVWYFCLLWYTNTWRFEVLKWVSS